MPSPFTGVTFDEAWTQDIADADALERLAE